MSQSQNTNAKEIGSPGEGADAADLLARAPKGAGEGACAPQRVSPGSAGLKAGVFEAPGFGHAEVLGDTEYVFCVMLSRIKKL